MRTGGQLIVDQLVVHGVDVAFGVPGESYLAVLDALHDAPIRFVSCRHEVGAANMADAYGKLTGRPGVCMVTRGPGATHAAGGIHTAYQDSTPLILLIGQVGREMMEREAFQEIDYRQMFGPMAKWVAQIDSADRVPELLSRAFHVATAGRPGPVVLALPEDMLVDESSAEDAATYSVTRVHPAATDVDAARELLAGAERPLVIVGGAPWGAEANDALTRWCVESTVPVASGWRCQDYVDNTADVYVGHLGLGPDPRLAQRVRAADVLLVIGDRLSEITTSGYTLLEVPIPAQSLIHVSADPNELGRVYAPTLGIVASPDAFSRSLAGTPALESGHREAETLRGRADYLANLVHTPAPGDLDMGEVMATLRKRLPADAILTNGAGNFTVWAHRFFEFRQYRTQLAPTSGAMGYGVPAAVAAKILYPERTVVCMAGDGDFLMTGQELATAVQENAAVVILVVNNGMYGTIRMHQERHYPGRVSGTDLVNPDFAALARAFGAHGALVERTADFAAAFDEALDCGRPALIELRVDREALTPRQSLSEVREAAQARLSPP
ncbi:thiamine pyrophosphate-binding protein [Gaiella sp.]|uniref:thiamine pyrophosphate-binding protein n=1 Tax=Gaiella sp. TaxID=2663207 RepID=UPI0032667EF8